MYHVFTRETNGQEQSRDFPSLQDALDWCLMGFLHTKVLSIEIREDADYPQPGSTACPDDFKQYCCLMCDGSGTVLDGGKRIPCPSCGWTPLEEIKKTP